MPTPQEWAFTQETNEEQRTEVRLSYVRAVRELLVLALSVFVHANPTTAHNIFQRHRICWRDLPTPRCSSRRKSCSNNSAYEGNGFTGQSTHFVRHGLRNISFAIPYRHSRSWHLSVSLTYLPAWIIVGAIWGARIYAESNVGLIIVVHVLFGLLLASWSFIVAAPFGKSPQLAAVVTTFLAIIIAVVALAFGRASTIGACIFTLLFPPAFYVFVIRAIAGYENQLWATDILKRDPDNNLVVLPLLIVAIVSIYCESSSL